MLKVQCLRGPKDGEWIKCEDSPPPYEIHFLGLEPSQLWTEPVPEKPASIPRYVYRLNREKTAYLWVGVIQ
jgi:hypothetical protein